VTAADLAAVLIANPVVVVHFWADWNGVDRLFDPKLANVRREFDGRIAFRSADVDDADLASFCRESGVVNVPALGCFVGGKHVKTIVGAVSEDKLRTAFRSLLPGSTVDRPGSAAGRNKQWWQFWK
jgi:thioredoxin-like negative regulator of GroEL